MPKKEIGPSAQRASNLREDAPRLYAIGDIHGSLDQLRQLHTLIASDAEKHQARSKTIVYLGDYIDRGPDSAAIIDLLLDRPLDGFVSVHLKGNHEDTLLRFLDGEPVGPMWFTYGGMTTLLSYGVKPPRVSFGDADMIRVREDLGRAVPQRHLDFFRTLRLTHDAGGYFFVHAGVRPGTALERQDPEDLMWIRDIFHSSDEYFGRIIVHGHHISKEPDIRLNRIGIDTGAFATGRLTCFIADGTGRTFLAT